MVKKTPVTAKAAKAAPADAAKPTAAPAKTPAVKGPPKAKAKVDQPKAAEVATKPKKIKLVRDSFTLPKDEMEVLVLLKQRCLKQGHGCKKSELLRAGIKVLAAMTDARLLAAVQAVPALKTGRPAKV